MWWYLPVEELEAPVSILVSVSKRRFKRAVKRNRVKRQIREAYRMNKHGLLAVLTEKKCRLAVAFIYLSDQFGRLFCHRGPYEDSFGTHCREGSGKC